jgi:hypothetical protein
MWVLTERCRVHPQSRVQALADNGTIRGGRTGPLSPVCCLVQRRKVVSARRIEYFAGVLPVAETRVRDGRVGMQSRSLELRHVRCRRGRTTGSRIRDREPQGDGDSPSCRLRWLLAAGGA